MAEEKESKTFNELYASLEEVINRLETGNLELDQSLNEYSKGVKIVAELQSKLDASEVMIKELAGEIDKDTESGSSTISHS